MRISESKIEEIRQAADIVDIISEKVQLRKRGKNFIGLCPFHNEKTPSFTVSEDKQIYHCFGCHAGGNVFNFLMSYEKISFVEAVQELAQQLGIELEFDQQAGEEKQSAFGGEQEILYEINTEAARYFSDNLLNKPEGEIARNYFLKRNIKPQTMRVFGLGYAIPGWDNFIGFAQSNTVLGDKFEKALSLGLIGKSGDGRYYDKFSGRIIFPIFSPNGRVVAFAGRILVESENHAKYLNSPESLIYVKGRVLYGLSHAKDEIRKLDKAILVEGYMDLISLFQSGIKNVVAVSGTSLTEEQVQLLSRYTKNVVLLFDADTAGIKASMRSIELLLKRDFEIKIVSLPQGEDPDSYVNKFGREKFEEMISYAQNFLEYQTAYFQALGMFDEPAKTAGAIRELMKPVSLIGDELKRTLLIKSIAKKFNLRESLLENELNRFLAGINKQLANDGKIKEREIEKKESFVLESQAVKENPVLYNIEKELVKFLFEGEEDIIELMSKYLRSEDFSIEAHRQLAELVFSTFESKNEIVAGSLIDKIDDDKLRTYILELTFDKYSISKSWEDINPGRTQEVVLKRMVLDTLKRFKSLLLEQELNSIHKRIEAAGSEEEKIELMKNIRDLRKEAEQIVENFDREEAVN